MSASSVPDKARNGLFYGWVILAASCFGMFAASVVRSSIGIWVIPMQNEFGVDRAAISSVGTIFSLVFGVAQPFIGRAADRLGPRWAIAGGTWAIGLGLIALLSASQVWQVWIWYSGLVAIGFAASSFVTQSALLSRWFLRYRSRALAGMTAGFSLGFVVMIQVVTAATQNFGWQNTAAAMGVFYILISAPVALLVIRNKPEDVDQLPDGATALPGAAPVKPVFVSLGEAARTGSFWLLIVGYVSCGFVITMVQFHLIPLARGLVCSSSGDLITCTGEQASAASWTLAIVALANTAAALPLGWLGDRIGKKWILVGSYGLRVVAFLYLFTVTDIMGVYIFSLLFGLTWLNTIPPTSGLTADIFGRFSVGLLFGFIAMGHEFGGAVAVQLAGYIYDATGGSYGPALLMGAGLSAIATVASMAIRDRPVAALRPAPVV